MCQSTKIWQQNGIICLKIWFIGEVGCVFSLQYCWREGAPLIKVKYPQQIHGHGTDGYIKSYHYLIILNINIINNSPTNSQFPSLYFQANQEPPEFTLPSHQDVQQHRLSEHAHKQRSSLCGHYFFHYKEISLFLFISLFLKSLVCVTLLKNWSFQKSQSKANMEKTLLLSYFMNKCFSVWPWTSNLNSSSIRVITIKWWW